MALFRTVLFWLAPLLAFGGPRELAVVTLNMAKETSAPKIAAELRSIDVLRDADVYLLQETLRGTAGPVAAALGLRAAEVPESPETRDIELAILSRYPIRDVRVRTLSGYSLVYHTRVRYALSAAIDTPWGSVQVVNAHLDTRINIADRLAQLDGALAAAPAGTAIVAGDFNSNPFFWIDHVMPLPAVPPQSERVEQHMRARGFESAIPRSVATFDYLGMHLDWIWLRGLRTIEWRVIPLRFSDHHACWARVRF